MAEIKVGLIGGSGMGEALRAQTQGVRHEMQTPFGPPSDAILESNWEGLSVCFLARHGPGHLLGPGQVPFRANIFALKQLGVTHIVATGAVGSLREEFKPRDLVIPDQIIDKTQRRAGTFFEKAAVHVEFAEPFCQVLRQVLVEEGRGSAFGVQGSAIDEGQKSGSTESSAEPRTANREPSVSATFTVHDRGCYVCMEGPAFSTRAESLMHRIWGGDLIGMTAMPEAKLAREAEISYALVALVTDYDCWRKPAASKAGADPSADPDPDTLLKEIIANLKAATDNGMALIRQAVRTIASRPELRERLASAPAQRSLERAIWSDQNQIPREEVQLLAPLWMKYLK